MPAEATSLAESSDSEPAPLPDSIDRAPYDAALRAALLAPAPGSTLPPHGPVRILVLGPTGLPLPSLSLHSRTTGCGSEAVPLGVTDSEGRLTATDLPYDGQTFIEDADVCHAPVIGPDLLIHADVGIELRVLALDAESGAEVRRARWIPRLGERTGNGVARVVAAGPGRRMDLWWAVLAPTGYVAFDEVEVNGLVSRYATSLFAAYPLRREADVEVEVREADGRPARDADVTGVWVAGRGLDIWRTERFAAGVLRIRDVPFLRGEPLSIYAAPPNRASRGASWSGALPEEVGIPTRGRIDLPLPEAVEPIGLGEGSGGCFSSRGCGHYCDRSSRGTEGSVTVVVRRRDGTPAAGANVRLDPAVVLAAAGSVSFRKRNAILDTHGRFTWEKLFPQRFVVRLQEPGLVPCEASVELPPNGDVVVELVEPSGGDVEVVVVDEDGRGLPFATIEVKTESGLEWLDVADDGAQRIDPFVDERGRRRLAHVEPGTLELSATFGTRKGTATASVDEGGRTVARVLIK